jgi:DHA1 family bicyclomycin/chloramphenicol resistance-like MFS transporter
MDVHTDAGKKPEQGTPWRLLALLMAMTAIGPATLNMMVPALPGLTRILESDSGTVQLTLSLFLLSLATAQLLLGPLSDRFGRRPVVLGGIAITVLASLAGMTASSIHALIAVRILQAIGAATGIVMSRAIIRDLFDRNRAAAMIGLVTTAMVIAPMVSPMIGGILDTTFGWEAIFLFITCFSAIVWVWAAATLPETRPAGVEHTPGAIAKDTRALLGNAKFLGYVLAAALGSAPFFTFLGGGPYIVVTMMGRASVEFGFWFALTSLGYMGGNFSVSRLSQRFGVDALIMAGIAIELVGAVLGIVLVAMLPDAGPVIIFVPQAIIAFGNGLMLPNAIAAAVSVRPQAAGTASGITGFTQMALGAAATQAASIMMSHVATPMPMAWMLTGLALLAAVVYRALARR